MQTLLATTALLMGLTGGPHCLAMCGAACGGLGRSGGTRGLRDLLAFQAGRLLGYAVLGAVAAGSVQAMGWLGTQSAALRPLWTLFHVAALLLGLVLLWRARQPWWLEGAGRQAWAWARTWAQRTGLSAGFMLGLLWALLPCGLLYSALMVAALPGQPWAGAGVMALFALGSGVVLLAGPWLWWRLRGQPGTGQGDWGVRLAGLALAGLSGWALWLGVVHNQAPWCVPLVA